MLVGRQLAGVWVANTVREPERRPEVVSQEPEQLRGPPAVCRGGEPGFSQERAVATVPHAEDRC